MIKPIKPTIPKKPKMPDENKKYYRHFVDVKELFDVEDDSIISIKNLLSNIPSEIDMKDIFITPDQFSVYYQTPFDYNKAIENYNYDMIDYNNNIISYNLNIENYKKEYDEYKKYCKKVNLEKKRLSLEKELEKLNE